MLHPVFRHHYVIENLHDLPPILVHLASVLLLVMHSDSVLLLVVHLASVLLSVTRSDSALLSVMRSDSALLSGMHSDSALLSVTHSDSALLSGTCSDSVFLSVTHSGWDQPVNFLLVPHHLSAHRNCLMRNHLLMKLLLTIDLKIRRNLPMHRPNCYHFLLSSALAVY